VDRMNVFELEGVTKKYGDRTVLKIPELLLESNKIYALMGPNGAGKTTLLRILNLLDKPDTGSMKFMGKQINFLGTRDTNITRQMCMVFQRPHMFKTTVWNNIAFGLKFRGLKGADIEKRVKEIISFVGLNSFQNKMATTLSGGEMQRVALARALVLQPSVLLLDEPTSNLDPSSVQIIEDIIRASYDRYGMTILVITHNLFQAKRLAQDALFMMDGEIIEQGNIPRIFTESNDPRTRSFLDGTMVC
jgi:tungstate transport system ATP-binding protein